MVKTVKISKTGYDKLHEELSRLEKEADEVRQRVAEARAQGDLSENSEFIYGRQQLGFIEGRLGELRAKINHSEVVDCTKVPCDKAVFGTVVTLLDLNTQQKVIYQLLGPNDADIDNGSISIHSPVGDAIHDLKMGDKGSANTPRGKFEFEVLGIDKSRNE